MSFPLEYLELFRMAVFSAGVWCFRLLVLIDADLPRILLIFDKLPLGVLLLLPLPLAQSLLKVLAAEFGVSDALRLEEIPN